MPPVQKDKSILSDRPHEQQLRFARLSHDLLLAKLPASDGFALQAIYKRAIVAKGLRKANGRVDHIALAAALRNYYEDFASFVHRERILSTVNFPLRWLYGLLERPQRASHPICHILLIGFLFGTITRFREEVQNFRGVTELHTKRSRSSDRLSGASHQNGFEDTAPLRDKLLLDGALSCRHVAQKLNLSTTTVVVLRRLLSVYVKSRSKYINDDLRENVVQDLLCGLKPPDVAKLHGVSISSVYRIRLQVATLLQEKQKSNQLTQLENRRTAWLQALEQCASVGLRAARSTAGAHYAWLYRHDRKWLQDACRLDHPPRVSRPRVDWVARDEELCARVDQFVATIQHQPERPWLSRSYLVRQLGEAMIRKNLCKLPRLQSKLSALSESREAYQMRRIARAIEHLHQEFKPVTWWRVQACANIRQWTPALRAHALSLVTKLSSITITVEIPC